MIVPECFRIFNCPGFAPVSLSLASSRNGPAPAFFVKSSAGGLPKDSKWARMETNVGVRMKPKLVPLPNVYDEAKFRRSGWRYPSRRAFLRVGLVLVALIAIR